MSATTKFQQILKVFILTLMVQLAISACNDPNCNPSYCSDPNVCTKCNQGSDYIFYGLVGGSCVQCKPGFHSPFDGPCGNAPCVQNCQKCNSMMTCFKCQERYIGTFIAKNHMTDCTVCRVGQYSSGFSSQTTCTKCSDNCEICASPSQCGTCLSNYTLTASKKCLSCAAGEQIEGDTCKSPPASSNSSSPPSQSNTRTIVLAVAIPVGTILLIAIAVCIYKKCNSTPENTTKGTYQVSASNNNIQATGEQIKVRDPNAVTV